MLSKKFSLFAVLFCLITSAAVAQKEAVNGFDVTDASKVSASKKQQHTNFMNATYDFPPKPKNQWELGVKYGILQVAGDVPSQLKPDLNIGFHIRKALGYSFSLRLEGIIGKAYGLSWRQAQNYGKNPAWKNNYNAPSVGYVPYQHTIGTKPSSGKWDPVYYNYKTNIADVSLQGIVNLGNISFHKAATKVSVYSFVGVGATAYNTKINALSNSTPYNFSTVQGVFTGRKATKTAIKNILDDSYETKAEAQGVRRAIFNKDKTLRTSATIGAGLAYKLGKIVNLALESRWTFIKDDLLDGQRWQEQAWGDAALTRDFDSYNFTSLGLNFNIGKGVQPLYWLNPLGYAYAELRNPKLMKLPKPVLDDTDGDGVIDQFDLEQTPKGCPVDSHGVSLDTDGDGVPDCKDKQKITPTICQPVDADGVGKCPCPDPSCYEGLMPPPTKKPGCEETLGSLPSVSFKSNSNSLTPEAQAVLASVAAKLRNSPECKVVVIGFGASDKKQQQLSWDHVNKVINHLTQKEGISGDRFIFNYGQDGPSDTVDLRGAKEGEDGPNSIAPPHPNLRKN